MRKIKVSGCLNCPFRMQDADGAHLCDHPSFGVNGVTPSIPPKYIDDLRSGVEYVMCQAEYMPSWCPLEYDGLVCVSQPMKC